MHKLSVKLLSILGLLLLSNLVFALPFTVVTKSGTQLPTTIDPGNTIPAYYTVTNNTGSTLSNSFVKYLPPNVSQVTSGGGNCGTTFNLPSHASCTLELRITGAVDANDPDPRHHLFVCMQGGTSCAGTPDPLNVIVKRTLMAYMGASLMLKYCVINDDGTLGVCVDKAFLNMTTIGAVAVNPNRTKIYVANFNQGGFEDPRMEYCSLNLDGSVADDCAETGSGMSLTPNDIINNIAINSTGTMAYIAVSPSQIYSCSINGNGSLGSCTLLSTSALPFLAYNESNNKLYTVNDLSPAQQCSINGSGVATTCSNISIAPAARAKRITLNATGTAAYISEPTTSPSTYYCNISSSDGTFTSCTLTNPSLRVYSIALNPTDTLAYFITNSQTDVLYCPVNTDNSLGTCAIAKNFPNDVVNTIAIA